MGLKAVVKRAVYPIAKRSVKIYYHDRKVLAAKLKRAVYGNPSHIIDTHVGDLRHNGGKYALFLIWQPKEIPWYVENALVALKEAGVNTDLPPGRPSFITRVLGVDSGRFRVGQARLARNNQVAQAPGALLRVFGCPARNAA